MSFSFGTKPAFGTPNTSFGTPASTFGAQQQNFSFNTPTTQSSLFGTPFTQPSGFGTPASTTQPSLFSTPSSTPAAPLSFGTLNFPAATSTAFGTTPASAAPATGFSFGQPTANTGLSFGAPTPSAGMSFNAPSSTGLNFGNPAAANKSTLSFGTPATSPPSTLNFGAPTSTAAGFALPTTTRGLGLSFGTTPTTSAPTLNFGSASLGGGLSFGTPATSTPGLSFGNFGAASSVATTPATTSASTGLGGIATCPTTSTTISTKTEQAPKEQNLPNEIQQTVDNFKNFVKQQKSHSSDVARCSVKEFKKVEEDINAANDILNEVKKQLQLNKSVAEKLKYDTARGLQQVEMAQRTYDTPLGLQYENNAPLMFFMELADHFEREMQNMKLQIENTDKYVKNIGNPTPLSSQDLSLGLKRIHETFVALAGRLQAVHSQVETQKEQYLTFRKTVLNDSTNVFEKRPKESDALNIALNSIRFEGTKFATGPTPFNAISHPSVIQAAAQNTPPSAYQQNNTFSGFSTNLATSGIFGSSSLGAPGFNSPSTSGFQLQKPPTGNKRGKQ